MNVNEGGANVTEGKANLDGRCGPHRARRWSPFSSSFVAALAIATASFLVLASLALVFVPPVGLSLERAASGDWVVSDVPVAESAWLAGVRRGMTVAGVTPETDPTHWDSLLLSDGTMFVTIERNPRPPGVLVLVPGVLALLVAIAAYRLAPGMASWLLVIPALTSLAFASDFVPAPIAFGLIVAPPAIGVLHIVERRRDLPRFATGVAATAVALVGVGWILAYVLRFESWDVPRQLTAAFAVGLLGLGTGCFGLFIASGSFFFGQAKFIPEPVRIPLLIMVPALAPLVALIYWMWRVRVRNNLRGIVAASASR